MIAAAFKQYLDGRGYVGVTVGRFADFTGATQHVLTDSRGEGIGVQQTRADTPYRVTIQLRTRAVDILTGSAAARELLTAMHGAAGTTLVFTDPRNGTTRFYRIDLMRDISGPSYIPANPPPGELFSANIRAIIRGD